MSHSKYTEGYDGYQQLWADFIVQMKSDPNKWDRVELEVLFDKFRFDLGLVYGWELNWTN